MNGGNGYDDGSGPPGNDDNDDSLGVLGQLIEEPMDGFGERVRRRIERRSLGGNVASLVWYAPAAILLELLAMIFEVVVAVEPGEGGTR